MNNFFSKFLEKFLIFKIYNFCIQILLKIHSRYKKLYLFIGHTVYKNDIVYSNRDVDRVSFAPKKFFLQTTQFPHHIGNILLIEYYIGNRDACVREMGTIYRKKE